MKPARPRKCILLLGKRNSFLESLAHAFPQRGKFQIVPAPLGSEAFRLAQKKNVSALLFVLNSSDDLESMQWLRQSNPSLPSVAILPQNSPSIQKTLRNEALTGIILARGLVPSDLRRCVEESLAMLHQHHAPSRTDQQIAADLHSVRSTMTAIQGCAELAIPKSTSKKTSQEYLRGVIAGVRELETTLRRLEGNLRNAGHLPD